ncbi:MAG: DNA translocase FtsK [Candidatus Symbiobacter sp.]|nr:DNA translocase FtsK [Candidatus Symbiobacter sp.]
MFDDYAPKNPYFVLPRGTMRYVRQGIEGLCGLAVMMLAVGWLLSALSYHPTDPSPLRAVAGPVQNWLGPVGAGLADIGRQSFGYAWYLPIAVLVVWGWRLFDHRPMPQFWTKLAAFGLALLLAAVALGCFAPRAGGMIGVLAAQQAHNWVPVLGGGVIAGLMTLCALASLVALAYSFGCSRQEWQVFGARAGAWTGHHSRQAATWTGRGLTLTARASQASARRWGTQAWTGAARFLSQPGLSRSGVLRSGALWAKFGRRNRASAAASQPLPPATEAARMTAASHFATDMETSPEANPEATYNGLPPEAASLDPSTPPSSSPSPSPSPSPDLFSSLDQGFNQGLNQGLHQAHGHAPGEEAEELAEDSPPSPEESFAPSRLSSNNAAAMTAAADARGNAINYAMAAEPESDALAAQAPFTAAFAAAKRVHDPYLTALRPQMPPPPNAAAPSPFSQVSQATQVSQRPQVSPFSQMSQAAQATQLDNAPPIATGATGATGATAPIGQNFARSLSDAYQHQMRPTAPPPMAASDSPWFEGSSSQAPHGDGAWHDTLPPAVEELADDSWQLPGQGPVEQRVASSGFSPASTPVDAWQLPAISFLTKRPASEDNDLDGEDHDFIARQLEAELANFNVYGDVVNFRPGPVVTLYEFEPAPGIKTAQVIKLADDLARAMSAIAVRIAVVPGRSVFGIELPNLRRRKVYLRDVLESEAWHHNEHKLPLALGKDIGGMPVLVDLAKMPHLLIAGTTGSGKSVGINTMILSLLYRLSPSQCRMIMIDPKMLELSVYEGIPHLLAPVVTDPKKAVVALKWAVREMEQRYNVMKELGVRDIDSYNRRIGELAASGAMPTRQVVVGFDRTTGEKQMGERPIKLEPYPKIVIIVDELADLMIVAGKEIEGSIQRLAQMARAAGIHLVMATQRPSVDVITGTIKTNFPTRISFYLASTTDSRTILGVNGAEQLLGQGDMLYMMGGGRIKRVHGPFVTEGEVEEIVAALKAQSSPQFAQKLNFDDELDEEEGNNAAAVRLGSDDEGEGELYDRAIQVVARTGKATTSSIQRHLRIGYNRAATLIERMEDEGLIGPQLNQGGKREIMIPRQRGANYDFSPDND